MTDKKSSTVRKYIYLHELKGAGYDLDAVLDLLKKDTLKAQGRHNADYRLDLKHPDYSQRGHLEKVETISQEEWQDLKFKKKLFSLVDEGDCHCYSLIKVDRKKLDKAMLVSKGGGAPRQFDEEQFYSELVIYVHKNKVSSPTHDGWCTKILADLPSFQKPGARLPSPAWVKRKTQYIWDRIKSP
jgi:hypothetical protein